MRCPHCAVDIFPNEEWTKGVSIGVVDEPPDTLVVNELCPSCLGWFIELQRGEYLEVGRQEVAWAIKTRTILWPRVSSRQPIPGAVPDEFASLAREAGLILGDSPRASAALSRRCLQQLLRDRAGAPPSNLFHEIEWAIENANLPSHARESLHDLREIGNMAEQATSQRQPESIWRSSRARPTGPWTFWTRCSTITSLDLRERRPGGRPLRRNSGRLRSHRTGLRPESHAPVQGALISTWRRGVTAVTSA